MNSEKLKVGAVGNEVSRLHQTLNNQGFEVSAEEVKRKFFGPSTREAVGEFQKTHGIESSCEVCDQTATLLFNTSETAMSGSETGEPILASESDLGVSHPPSEAKFASTGESSLSGITGVPDKFVSGGKTASSKVNGQIFLDNGLPASGVTVRVYDRGFGGRDTLLGESKTNDKGTYNLAYRLSGKSANLEIRVINNQGKEISLSKTKFSAKPEEVLNLVAPASVQPFDAEYQRLAADLNQQLDGLSRLAQAEENGDRRDLTLLHQTTDWDARLIALTASAVKLSSDTSIPQDVLYALFRVGLPTDKEQLAQLSEQTVEQAIAKARDSNIVSLMEGQVVEAKAAFNNFARQSRRAA
ncbi:MAG: peptidoglycan-binding protein, partial [Waterburya sp.]